MVGIKNEFLTIFYFLFIDLISKIVQEQKKSLKVFTISQGEHLPKIKNIFHKFLWKHCKWRCKKNQQNKKIKHLKELDKFR